MIVLQGGGPFTANDDLDRQILDELGVARVVVMPTADAFEHPERSIDAAHAWAERLGAGGASSIEVEALMVLRRADALEVGATRTIAEASIVYLVGDQSLHLRSVVKGTPLADGLVELARRGALVACGASAAALCDPMVDPRGGAPTLGLGLIEGLALVTESETWSPERLHRTLELVDTAVATVPTGAALVLRDGEWEQVGDVELRGTLP